MKDQPKFNLEGLVDLELAVIPPYSEWNLEILGFLVNENWRTQRNPLKAEFIEPAEI